MAACLIRWMLRNEPLQSGLQDVKEPKAHQATDSQARAAEVDSARVAGRAEGREIMATNKIQMNVCSFLDKAAVDFGAISAKQFDCDIYNEIIDGRIDSPIEQLFYIAARVMCASQRLNVNPEPWRDDRNTDRLGYGVFIQPQYQAGKFHVDFLLSQNGNGPDDIYSPVVVELDGHDFHDKDKRQRSYEKSRDRFLVKSGFKVLHFTGSEVVADPYKVAFEALELLGVFVDSGIESYRKKTPFGAD